MRNYALVLDLGEAVPRNPKQSAEYLLTAFRMGSSTAREGLFKKHQFCHADTKARVQEQLKEFDGIKTKARCVGPGANSVCNILFCFVRENAVGLALRPVLGDVGRAFQMYKIGTRRLLFVREKCPNRVGMRASLWLAKRSGCLWLFVNLNEVHVKNSSRRQFLGISVRTAGKLAATGLVSLPMLSSMSKKADALGWGGWKDDAPSHGPHGPSGGGGSGKCFLRGTLIQTAGGEVPVEELKIGTLVDTLRGPRPIKWIGRQTFEKASPSWHWSVAPIRVAQFALSDEYPRRDLFLSPHHSLFIDGLLIPVEWLVNGKSITLTEMDDREAIDYFHIELETHEVVFAEGTPAETLLVDNDREHFRNFVQYEQLYGIGNELAMKPFAPRLEYQGPSGELNRLLRSAVLPFIDVRDPIQKARARIAAKGALIHS